MATNEEFDRMIEPLEYADILSKINIFANLNRNDILDLANGFKQITLNPGENLISQGEKVNFFFVVLAGEVVVSKKPSVNEAAPEITILREVSHCGALPIFFDCPSRVTVKAKNQVKCIHMDR